MEGKKFQEKKKVPAFMSVQYNTTMNINKRGKNVASLCYKGLNL